MNRRDVSTYAREQAIIAERYKSSILGDIRTCTDGCMLLTLAQAYRDLEIKIRLYDKLAKMVASIDLEEEDVSDHIADVSKKVVDE